MRRLLGAAAVFALALTLAGPAPADGKKDKNDGIITDYGKPKGFPGETNSFWLWHEDGRWHLRTTGHGKGAHRFEGRIDVVGGQLVNLKGKAGEYGGKLVDRYRFGPTTLQFDFQTDEGVDGINFATDATAHTLKVRLVMDGHAAPKHVRVGRHSDHPSGTDFTVPAHPPEGPDGPGKKKKK